MNSKIFFFLLSEEGLSVTTTNEGLFEDALISPHEPSSNENLIPFTVKIFEIFRPSILLLLSFYSLILLINSFLFKSFNESLILTFILASSFSTDI